MHPVLIDLGFYQVPTYGVLLSPGIILAIYLASRRAVRVGLLGETRVMDLAAWVVLWGLVGAKILLAITDPSLPDLALRVVGAAAGRRGVLRRPGRPP